MGEQDSEPFGELTRRGYSASFVHNQMLELCLVVGVSNAEYVPSPMLSICTFSSR